jgi:hypothetical protein
MSGSTVPDNSKNARAAKIGFRRGDKVKKYEAYLYTMNAFETRGNEVSSQFLQL